MSCILAPTLLRSSTAVRTSGEVSHEITSVNWRKASILHLSLLCGLSGLTKRGGETSPQNTSLIFGEASIFYFSRLCVRVSGLLIFMVST